MYRSKGSKIRVPRSERFQPPSSWCHSHMSSQGTVSVIEYDSYSSLATQDIKQRIHYATQHKNLFDRAAEAAVSVAILFLKQRSSLF